jgi:hypothetical protein
MEGIYFFPTFHPFAVVPSIVEIPYPRGGPRGRFGGKGEGVGLLRLETVIAGMNDVFIKVPRFQVRNEAGPDPRLPHRTQGMALGVPAVEIPRQKDPFRIGGPDGEMDPLDTLVDNPVGPQFFIEAKMASFIEEIKVFRGQKDGIGNSLRTGTG